MQRHAKADPQWPAPRVVQGASSARACDAKHDLPPRPPSRTHEAREIFVQQCGLNRVDGSCATRSLYVPGVVRENGCVAGTHGRRSN